MRVLFVTAAAACRALMRLRWDFTLTQDQGRKQLYVWTLSEPRVPFPSPARNLGPRDGEDLPMTPL